MGLKIVGLQEREISRVYLTGGKSKADNTRLPRGGERAFNGFLGCISRALERRKEGRNEQHESYFTGQERRRKGLIIFSVDTFFLFLDWDFRFIFFTLLSTTAISVIPRSALGGGVFWFLVDTAVSFHFYHPIRGYYDLTTELGFTRRVS